MSRDLVNLFLMEQGTLSRKHNKKEPLTCKRNVTGNDAIDYEKEL